MLRRDAWAAVGGFDEGYYPLWFEDVDLLQRLHEQGFGVRYVPGVAARHRGGHSVARLPTESRPVYWYASLLRYSCRHFRAPGRVVVAWAVVVGSLMRMFREAVRQRSLKPIAIYGRVVRSACLRLMRGRTGEAAGMSVLARE